MNTENFIDPRGVRGSTVLLSNSGWFSLHVRYILMKKCWKLSPSERPCFSELVVSLEKMLMSVANYIELNMTLVETEDEEEWMQYEEVDDMAMKGEFRSVPSVVIAFISLLGFR